MLIPAPLSLEKELQWDSFIFVILGTLIRHKSHIGYWPTL